MFCPRAPQPASIPQWALTTCLVIALTILASFRALHAQQAPSQPTQSTAATATEPDAAEPDAVSTSRVRAATWEEAYWNIRASLQERWDARDYRSIARDTVSLLRGNRVMREYLDNEMFLQWIGASFGLMLLGQIVLFALMGHQIRLMALVLPKRPLGPILVGAGSAFAAIPLTVGLCLSLIGIPVAALLWAGVYIGAVAGKMGLFLSIGWGISRAFGGGGRGVLPFFFVYVVYSAVVLLNPFSIGDAFFVVANLLGLGLALRTRFGLGVKSLVNHVDVGANG
ncbi:hypothetical protein FJZ36_11995 [Candidatus Poribacteria bacterium]|nr:hypothetical protein [Candidatus Poribacteria bacterium]